MAPLHKLSLDAPAWKAHFALAPHTPLWCCVCCRLLSWRCMLCEALGGGGSLAPCAEPDHERKAGRYAPGPSQHLPQIQTLLGMMLATRCPCYHHLPPAPMGPWPLGGSPCCQRAPAILPSCWTPPGATQQLQPQPVSTSATAPLTAAAHPHLHSWLLMLAEHGGGNGGCIWGFIGSPHDCAPPRAVSGFGAGSGQQDPFTQQQGYSLPACVNVSAGRRAASAAPGGV